MVREAGRRVARAESEFVWYALDVARVRQLKLRKGFELRRANEQEAAEWLSVVPAIAPADGPDRVREGVAMWFVLRDGEPAFTCSVFTHRFPLKEAPGGWCPLGPGVACMDNALTDRRFRGLAVAPTAFSAIAGILREQGYETLLTKVEPENIPPRTTIEKIGFREIGTMRYQRRWWRESLSLDRAPIDLDPHQSEAADELEATLTR
jgi:hypothetical protein